MIRLALLLSVLAISASANAATLTVAPHLGELATDGFVIACETDTAVALVAEVAPRAADGTLGDEGKGRLASRRQQSPLLHNHVEKVAVRAAGVQNVVEPHVDRRELARVLGVDACTHLLVQGPGVLDVFGGEGGCGKEQGHG